MVTVCAEVLGSSIRWATRTSMGLSVRPRSNCGPEEASREFCERGIEDDDELAPLEALRELSRALPVSWARPERFRRRTLRGWPVLGVVNLLDDDADDK
jgi:hypothetical protein